MVASKTEYANSEQFSKSKLLHLIVSWLNLPDTDHPLGFAIDLDKFFNVMASGGLIILFTSQFTVLVNYITVPKTSIAGP